VTQRYSPAFVVSIVLHVIVLLILIVSFEFSSTMPVLENADQNMKIINATIMDAPPAPALPEPAPAPAPELPKPIEEKTNAQAEAEAAAAKLREAQKQIEKSN
jgi:outer membrane biosynthesis protein TonB